MAKLLIFFVIEIAIEFFGDIALYWAARFVRKGQCVCCHPRVMMDIIQDFVENYWILRIDGPMDSFNNFCENIFYACDFLDDKSMIRFRFFFSYR